MQHQHWIDFPDNNNNIPEVYTSDLQWCVSQEKYTGGSFRFRIIFVTRADPKEKQKILQIHYGGKFLFYRQNYVIKIDSTEVLVFDYEYELCIEILPFDNELSKIKIDEFDGENITTIKKVGDYTTLLKTPINQYLIVCSFIQIIAEGLSSSGIWHNFLCEELYDPRLLILIRMFYQDVRRLDRFDLYSYAKMFFRPGEYNLK
mgnify:FL=1